MSAIDDLYAALDIVRAAAARREAEQVNPLQLYCLPADVERIRAAVTTSRADQSRPVEVHGSTFVPDGKVIVIDPLAMREQVVV